MKFTTKQLSYEDILQYVSEEDIALYYLGVTSKSKMFSFYREETNPGYYLYYKNGRMMYYDCVESRTLSRLIMEVNGWSFKDFIGNLKQDFSARLITPSKIKKLPKIESKPKHTEIKIKTRDWNQEDLNYWIQFGITKEILDTFNVKPISYYWINDFLYVAFKYHYSYDFYTENGLFRRKLYAPLEKKKKWINNGGAICQGESMLPYEGDLLIITKSLKDVMTLYSLGITAIAPPSESSFLPLGYYNKQKERFKKIVLFFDNDQTGIKKAKKFSEEYNLPYIYIPEGEEKDISDYRKIHGEEKTKELINKLLYESQH